MRRLLHIARRSASNRTYAEAYSNLGNALREQGSLDEAVAAYRQAIRIKPDLAAAYSNLGAALKERGSLDEAVAACRQAICIKPDFAEAHSNLGNALMERGNLDEAVAAYGEAIRIKPDYAEAYSNLGNALKERGSLDEAVAAYREAIRIKPDYAEAHSNLIMCLHYSSSVGNIDVHTEALEFGRRYDAGVGNFPHNNVRDPHRRLRIGYVSADFKRHPVGYFLSSVLSAHDHAVTEIYCYSNQVTDDDMSVRLRACADQWRSISRMADTDVAAVIYRDAIDILVDLSGHTGRNRLTMFALRPAPVQVSWLGYFGTTGLSSIDYILADRFIVPEGEQMYFTEAVWRLPGCYLCYTPYDLRRESRFAAGLERRQRHLRLLQQPRQDHGRHGARMGDHSAEARWLALVSQNQELGRSGGGQNAGRSVRRPWDCSGSTNLGGTLTIGRGDECV